MELKGQPKTRKATRAEPRWGTLYVVVAGPLVALTMLVLVPLPEAVRGALVYGLTLATVAAMALWVRANRVAIARQGACACSWEKTTVRVVPSRAPATSPRRFPASRAPHRTRALIRT